MINYNKGSIDCAKQISKKQIRRHECRKRYKYTYHKKCLDNIVLICNRHARFIVRLSSSAADLKKVVAYKKRTAKITGKK